MSPEKADQLQSRLVAFAISVVKMSAGFSATPAGRHLAAQILRSGTAAAPNYGEARGAESKADFVHKLRIALKELNETAIWLDIIAGCGYVKEPVLRPVKQECAELARILTASLRTLRSGRK